MKSKISRVYSILICDFQDIPVKYGKYPRKIQKKLKTMDIYNISKLGNVIPGLSDT